MYIHTYKDTDLCCFGAWLLLVPVLIVKLETTFHLKWSDGHVASLFSQLVTRCHHKNGGQIPDCGRTPRCNQSVGFCWLHILHSLRCFVVPSILNKLPLPHTSCRFKLLSCELSCEKVQEICAGILPESGLRHVVGIICVRQPDVFVFVHAQYAVVEKVFRKHVVRVLPRGQGETGCQTGMWWWVPFCTCSTSYVFRCLLEYLRTWKHSRSGVVYLSLSSDVIGISQD